MVARLAVFGLVLAGMLACGPARAQDAAYDLTIEGVDSDGLRAAIEEASRLRSLADRPPPSKAGLERRIEQDLDTIGRVLASRGYYAGTASADIRGDEPPYEVVLQIIPREQYRLEQVDLRFQAPRGAPVPALDAEALRLEPGTPARAEAVIEAETRLLAALAERGWPLAKAVDRDVVVRHEQARMDVTFVVDPGPKAVFGETRIVGLSEVEEAFVRNRLPWQPGETFRLSLLTEGRNALSATGLFGNIRIQTAQEVEEGGRLPVIVEVAERDFRSIGVGANYSTSQGVGVEAFWEHRNLFGNAERFRATAAYSETAAALSGSFRRPDVLDRPDLDFVADSSVEQEQTEVYETRSVQVSSGLEWQLSDRWWLSARGALERSFEEEDNRRRAFTLVSVPLAARRDSADDLLDPTQGGRTSLQWQPFLESLGSDVSFTRAEAGQTLYWQLAEEPRTILAGWGRLGAILAAKPPELPADKRFYAGGGGSVRGYGYQLAGPVDDQGDPVGGRSLLAFGSELRLNLTEDWGGVTFLEAGNAYPEQLPALNRELRWGAGFGVRYNTGFGPVRADIAFPLNRRAGIDDSFQLYLSLGQAF